MFRPPHGQASPRLISQARELGLHTVLGGVDSRDWSEPGSDAIYDGVVSRSQPGAVILMHELEQTVAALPRIITDLQSRGYHCLTVPQLLGLP